LYRYVEGITFQEVKATGDAAEIGQAAFAIGKTLARLSTAGVPAEIEQRSYCFLAPPLLENRVGAGDAERLAGFVSDWKMQIHEVFQGSALVRGDFNHREPRDRCGE
jgi:hypothetical protein